MDEKLKIIKREQARRELCRRHFSRYLPYVYGNAWVNTRFATFLAEAVQQFLETDTGHAYDILIINTPPQHGKECADSTLVPTPSGFKRHGDLKPGDYVFSPSGKPIKVLAEIPQTEPASLMVTFADGAQVKVHPNHEWVVKERRRKGLVGTVETHVMMEKGLHEGPKGRGGRYLYSVDPNVCIEYPEAEQPVHPYLFGLWLGDGTTVAPAITHHPDDKETIEKVERLGYHVSARNVHPVTGCLKEFFFRGEMLNGLRSLELGYQGCREKYLPDCYKIASKEQRLELLAGMIDSDGFVYRKNGRVTISNANENLIQGFAEVVRSLGWRTTISFAEPCVSSSGVHGKQRVYQLTFTPTYDIPTALPRKKTVFKKPCDRNRAIVSIEPCEPEHGKCITVEGGVYLVTDHFVPTHNSMTVSESLPSWVLGKHPDWRIIVAAYNDDLAGRFMRRNKEKIKEKCGKLFGIEIGDIDRADAIELKAPHRGGILSRGIRGGITGNPANLIIIDDPIKSREEADSETWRGKVWDEWQNSIKSRLAPGAKVIVIMTPWHEDDLSARILQTEQNATLVRLPVEAEEDDPLGRAVGEPLCPELGKDAAWLADFKKSYLNDPQGGSRAWSALYQCNPRVEGGNIIRREWWKFYNPKEIDWFGTEVISVDATFKKTDTSDYVAITVWGKRGVNDYYLRYCMNKRMTFSETLQAIRATRALYPLARAVLIEDKANGSAIIDVLQREMFCIAINPHGGKAARVNAVQPAIESGHVFLPEGEPWVADYIDQWCAFPAGAHDDMVDSSTQALGYMLFTSGAALPGKTDEQDEWSLGKYDDVLADSDTLFDPYGMGGF